MEVIYKQNLGDISKNVVSEKVDKTCRLCFSKLDTKPLFKLHFEGILLFEIYREITTLQAEEGDGLPEHICMTCVEQIVCTYVFIKNCKQSDKILRIKREGSVVHINEQDPNVSELEFTKGSVQCIVAEGIHETELELIQQEATMYTIEDQNEKLLLFDEYKPIHYKVEGVNGTDLECTLEEYNADINKTELESTHEEFVKYKTEDVQANDSELSYFNVLKTNIQTINDNQIKNNLKHTSIHEVVREIPKLTDAPFTCNKCDNSYETLIEFKQHYRRSTKCLPQIYPCNYCNKKFSNKYKVQLHMRTHTKEKPYECNMCDKKFRYLQNFVRHKKRHIEEKPYSCELCQKKFTRSATKIEHLRLHTGELPFLCTYCGKAYSKWSSLNLHTIKHRLENGKQLRSVKEVSNQFKCLRCSKRCATKKQLAIHEQSHFKGKVCVKEENNQLKKYLCSTCGKTYSTKATLVAHGVVHSKIKSHFCKLCNKAFCYKNRLKNHMLLHTGERPHICTICSRKFIQVGHLRQHIKTHSGEKTHVCDYCGKAFALKTNLSVHKRQHTGETPYHCSLCNRGFYDSSSMNKHLRTHKKDLAQEVHISKIVK